MYRIIHYVLLVSLLFSGVAQDGQGGQDQFILNSSFNAMIPNDMKNKMATESINRKVQFYEVIYNDSLVDIRFLKSSIPQAKKLRFTISPPDLKNYTKISTLVGFIYDSDSLIETIVWLRTEDQEGKKRFFTDYNQDGNFKNDGDPITVRNITTTKDIPVLINGEKDLLRISVQKSRTKFILKRFKNQPVLDMGLGVGSGELTYSHDNYSYLANFTNKSIRFAATYYIGPVVVGVRSSIENSNFYATYEIVNGKITTNVNKDKHPLNKMQLGGSLGLRAILTKTIEAQPLATYGYAYYFSPKYYPRRFSEEYHELDKSAFYEFGARMVFTVGNQRAIYLLVMRNFQEWEPVGLGGGSPFESSHKTTRFEVGYSIGL
ncbi:hypothetical protein [Ekhidna sp.]|uniref:hypothetical protein n=1 Tax=Ekhidna sp. TaxID=2608089 RepID=UPI003B500455